MTTPRKRPPKKSSALLAAAVVGPIAHLAAAAGGAHVAACRGCGCTEAHACVDPAGGGACWWVQPGLCSRCAVEEHPTVLLQLLFGHRAAVDNVVFMAKGLREQCLAGRGPAPWTEIRSELSALLQDLRRRATPAERDEPSTREFAEVFLAV